MKLMSGRMAAFAITFLTPVLLVRLFNQSEFGTYKQFILITFTPYLIGCAFSECLFYFLPLVLIGAVLIPAFRWAQPRGVRLGLTILVLLFPAVTLCVVMRTVVLRYYLS
jgi:hypothetical protein